MDLHSEHLKGRKVEGGRGGREGVREREREREREDRVHEILHAMPQCMSQSQQNNAYLTWYVGEEECTCTHVRV